MEKLSKSDLLPCLQYSDYCNNFAEEVSVPKKYVVDNLNITNDKEFDHLLKKLSYWMIRRIPHKVYNYVLFPPMSSNVRKLSFDKYKFEMYKELTLLNTQKVNSELLQDLLLGKRDNLVEFVVDKIAVSKDNKILMLRFGKIDLLKKIFKREGKNNRGQYENNFLEYVLFSGNLKLVKLMVEEYGYTFSNNSVGAAVISGNVELLKYICDNGASLERRFNADYWIQNGYHIHIEHYPSDYYVYSSLVFGSDKCLEYLLKKGLDLSEVEKWLDDAYDHFNSGVKLSAEIDWIYYYCTKEKYNKIVDVYNKFVTQKREKI